MPPLTERAAFLEVASLDFYRKRPRRLRLGRGTAFFPKESGGKERAGGLRPPWIPQYGGSWRRWVVRAGQRPGVHCRPSHWLVLAVIGAPAEAQRSGFGGERRPSGGNELSGLPGSERSVAWADDAAPRVARIGIAPQALKVAALYPLGPPGRRRCLASEIPGRLLWLGNGASRMPRPTSSAQATDRSLPGKPESSFPPLGLLSPRRPLRWVAAGAPIFTPVPSRGGVTA